MLYRNKVLVCMYNDSVFFSKSVKKNLLLEMLALAESGNKSSPSLSVFIVFVFNTN